MNSLLVKHRPSDLNGTFNVRRDSDLDNKSYEHFLHRKKGSVNFKEVQLHIITRN